MLEIKIGAIVDFYSMQRHLHQFVDKACLQEQIRLMRISVSTEDFMGEGNYCKNIRECVSVSVCTCV